MNLIEKISPSVSCHKLMILVKDHNKTDTFVIRAEDYNYYCHKYGHDNVELIARERMIPNETDGTTAV